MDNNQKRGYCQEPNKMTVFSFEDHKRGHYLERKFKEINFKINDTIQIEAELVGWLNPSTNKVTNRLLVKEISR